MSRREVPQPEMGETDPNEVLRRRLANTRVGTGSQESTPAHTPPTEGVRAGKGGTRPDPTGMKRTSLYVTASSAAALEQAADTVLAALGDDVPRHVALSALLEAASDAAPQVTQRLIRQRSDDLAARLQALNDQGDTA